MAKTSIRMHHDDPQDPEFVWDTARWCVDCSHWPPLTSKRQEETIVLGRTIYQDSNPDISTKTKCLSDDMLDPYVITSS